jgi:transcriptional regulator with XRE-family HTH domain
MIKVKRTLTEKRLIKNILFLKNYFELVGIKLHRKMGVSGATFGAWAEGRANPQTLHLEKISNNFKISIDDLVRKEITPKNIPVMKKKFYLIKDLLNS